MIPLSWRRRSRLLGERAELIVHGFVISVFRKPIKTLRLTVKSHEKIIHLSAPLEMTDGNLRLALVRSLPWIRKRIRTGENNLPFLPLQYCTGEKHYLWGQLYSLNILQGLHGSQITQREGAVLEMIVVGNSTVTDRSMLLREWYRHQIKAQLPAIIKKWERILGVQVEDWGVKNMKTRWGTCNIRSKRIWISLELSKRPLRCLEYVVVHELVHLLEKKHNARFYGFMDRFLSHWRECREELRNPLTEPNRVPPSLA